MNYVYDVLVNLSTEMYDFYDWEESDTLMHVRRIPIFKVNEKTYDDFYTKKIKVNEDFTNSIKDKTQIFGGRNIEIIESSCIISNGTSALMIEFNNEGKINRKSKFLINEELEIVEVAKTLKNIKIDYNILDNKTLVNKMIRSEKRTLKHILKELENLKDDNEKINYLYYEWFETEEGSNKYVSLVKSIKKEFTSKHEEFLELLNLLTIKK